MGLMGFTLWEWSVERVSVVVLWQALVIGLKRVLQKDWLEREPREGEGEREQPPLGFLCRSCS